MNKEEVKKILLQNGFKEDNNTLKHSKYNYIVNLNSIFLSVSNEIIYTNLRYNNIKEIQKDKDYLNIFDNNLNMISIKI